MGDLTSLPPWSLSADDGDLLVLPLEELFCLDVGDLVVDTDPLPGDETEPAGRADVGAPCPLLGGDGCPGGWADESVTLLGDPAGVVAPAAVGVVTMGGGRVLGDSTGDLGEFGWGPTTGCAMSPPSSLRNGAKDSFSKSVTWELKRLRDQRRSLYLWANGIGERGCYEQARQIIFSVQASQGVQLF
jgi:hypothetical protein